MILVDSSVWIDYFRGTATAQAEILDALLGQEPLIVGDLILAEVLQGFGSDRDFNQPAPWAQPPRATRSRNAEAPGRDPAPTGNRMRVATLRRWP